MRYANLMEETMPIYEYRCRKCQRVFERFQKVGEGGEKLTCPYCKEKKPGKMISSFSSSKGEASASSCGTHSSKFT